MLKTSSDESVSIAADDINNYFSEMGHTRKMEPMNKDLILSDKLLAITYLPLMK